MQAREKESSASPGRVRASFGLLNWMFSVNSRGKLEWKIAQASKQTRTLEYTPFPQTLNSAFRDAALILKTLKVFTDRLNI